MGVGKLFTVLLGLSPVVAILLYFVLQQQAVQNTKIDSAELEMKKDFAKFDKEFSAEKFLHADTKLAKKTYGEDYLAADNLVKKIEKEQNATKNLAVKNTKEVLNEIDNELKDEEFNF